LSSFTISELVVRNFVYIEIAVSRGHDKANTVNKQEKRAQRNLKSQYLLLYV